MINVRKMYNVIEKEGLKKSNSEVEKIMEKFHNDPMADFLLRDEHREATDYAFKLNNVVVNDLKLERDFETYEEKIMMKNPGVSSYDYEQYFGHLNEVHNMVVDRCVFRAVLNKVEQSIVYNLMMVHSNNLPYTFVFLLDDMYDMMNKDFDFLQRDYSKTFSYLDMVFKYHIGKIVEKEFNKKENRRLFYRGDKAGIIYFNPTEEAKNNIRFKSMGKVVEFIDTVLLGDYLEDIEKRINKAKEDGTLYEPITKYRDLGLTKEEEEVLKREVDKRIRSYMEQVKKGREGHIKDEEVFLAILLLSNGYIKRIEDKMENGGGVRRILEDAMIDEAFELLDQIIKVIIEKIKDGIFLDRKGRKVRAIMNVSNIEFYRDIFNI